MAGANPPELKYGDATDPDYATHRNEFLSFLAVGGDEGEQAARVREMVRSGSTRFALNMDDMRAWDRNIVDAFLQKPLERLAAWEDALRSYVQSRADLDTGSGKFVGAALAQHESRAYHIAVDGNLGVQRLTPYTLTAAHISQMVAVDGIATKLSLVRPKVVRSVHYNAALGTFQDARYHDATSITGFVTSSAYPTKDKDGNPLTTEFGLSTYEDHQTLVIQEMPERTQAGQMPRSVAAILDGDLVDRCKPGDRVRVTGVYRALAGQSQGETTGNFRTALIVNNVKQLTLTTRSSRITEEDVKSIRQVAKRKDAFELLSRSIAPSIEGHPYVKKAMLLLLLGGVEKNLENGSHIRGDINLLMIGDPSTAKSQLLRFLLHLAPLAINTTGRGSTGVGLTAAVHTSAETNDRVLEAGAMVLADRGIVCIDEFDKMSVADRVAIHEVMEQQTVTIAKAGIHMSLNARCSVVAAANPVYGQYDSSKGAADNIGLPDSILSRFDAVFVILDEADKVRDTAISGRVLANHRYYNPKLDADDSDDDAAADRDGDGKDDKTEVFEKFDKMLHSSSVAAAGAGAGAGASGRGGARAKAKAATELVTIGFLKKFIEFSKSNGSKVVLTPAAVDEIVREYTALRARKTEENLQLPITARTLETMIRLSTAHAKLRQSATVDKVDCTAALEIMKFAIENNTKPKAKTDADDDADDADDKDYKPRPKRGGGGGRGGGGKKKDDDSDDDDAGGGGDKKRAAKKSPASPKRAAAAAASPKNSPRRVAAAAADAKRQKADADAAEGDSQSQQSVRAGGKRKKAVADGKSKAGDGDDDAAAQVAAAAPATPTPAAAAESSAADGQGSPKRQRTGRRAAAPAAAAAAAMADDEPASSGAAAASSSVAAAAAANTVVAADGDADGDAAGGADEKLAVAYVDPARLEAYQAALGDYFGQTRKQHVPAVRFLAVLNAKNTANPFDADESDAILAQLQADGKVMYSKDDGAIHRTV